MRTPAQTPETVRQPREAADGITSDVLLTETGGSRTSVASRTGIPIINDGLSGSTVLALDSNRLNSGAVSGSTPQILFGYGGQFDTNL
jgi:hypothetical protein